MDRRAIAAELLSHDSWSPDQLRGFQSERLRELLRHAVSSSPYYRDVLGLRVADGDIALAELPVLSKTTLMAEFDRIVTDPRLRRAQVEAHASGQDAAELYADEFRVCATSGTTGEHALIAYSRREFDIWIGRRTAHAHPCRRHPRHPRRDDRSAQPAPPLATDLREPAGGAPRRSATLGHRTPARARDHAPGVPAGSDRHVRQHRLPARGRAAAGKARDPPPARRRRLGGAHGGRGAPHRRSLERNAGQRLRDDRGAAHRVQLVRRRRPPRERGSRRRRGRRRPRHGRSRPARRARRCS